MMKSYPFYLVNVFAESHFGGNPLAVFPNADGLSDATMQAIACQFNLSETVFFNKGTKGAAVNLRIFTPSYELPLAGHPILGSAFVAKSLQHLDDEFTLNTLAKQVNVCTDGDHVAFRLSGYTARIGAATHDELAQLVSLATCDIAEQATWVNSGTEQLLLQVFDKEKLYSAKVNADSLQALCTKDNALEMLYLWYDDAENECVYVRLFFMQGGVVIQDSGTGSACANLGAYFISQGNYPITRHIIQGDDMGRPNRLTLKVDSKQNIHVGGRVIKVGQGELLVP